MSYILEALRKAERDRHMSRIPTLATAHAAPEARRQPLWVWSVAAGVVLSAVLVYGYIRVTGDADPPRRAALPPATAAGPATPGAGVAVAVPTPVESAPEQEEVAPAGVPGPVVERPPASRAPTPPPTNPRVARSTAAPRRPPSPVVRSAAPKTQRAAVVEPSPASPPAAASGQPVTEPRPVPDPVTPAVVARPAPDPVAPAAAGPALPRLALDVLVYSDVPAERLVFINGRKYIEGQAVDDDAVIEQITPEGVVIRHQGRRLVLRPKLNPYARPGSP